MKIVIEAGSQSKISAPPGKLIPATVIRNLQQGEIGSWVESCYDKISWEYWLTEDLIR